MWKARDTIFSTGNGAQDAVRQTLVLWEERKKTDSAFPLVIKDDGSLLHNIHSGIEETVFRDFLGTDLSY